MEDHIGSDIRSTPERLYTLRALGLLNSPPDPALDRLTRLAARLLRVPVSLISLIEPERQRFLSQIGVAEPWASARETPLSHSFCQYVVADRAPFVVPDARRHPRVSASPAIPELDVIAYAGVPLITPNGEVLGALCAIDHAPRDWSPDDLLLLADLAAGVMAEITLKQARAAEQLALEQQRQATAALSTELAERQRAEVALRANEARLDAILRSAMDAIITVDSAQGIVQFNRAAELLFGYSAAQVLGKPLDVLLPDRYREAYRDHIPAFGAVGVANRAMGTRMTLMALRSDGNEFPIEAAISHAEVSGAHWYTVIMRDISLRLAAEEKLRASEMRFTAFMNLVPAAAWICDVEGSVRYVNAAYSQLIALLPVDPVGRHLRELLPATVADEYLRKQAHVLASGQPYEEIAGQVRPDGTAGSFLIYYFPLMADSDTPMVGGMAIDISERIRLEEQRLTLERSLLEAQKLESLGVLAGGIAHDFNNLLVAVLGNVDLALLELESRHPAYPSVVQVGVASQRAAELTQQLLAYSGHGRFVVEPLSLNSLISELNLLFRTSLPKSVEVVCDVAAELPVIEADATQIRQIIMNLVSNAAEATSGVGLVVVRTRIHRVPEDTATPGLRPGVYAQLEVIDTGCGMDVATQARIFEPFFSTKFIGRGLGMAAVQGIVRAHRGTIHVQSTPNNGTTIRVLLPAASGARVTPAPSAPLHAPADVRTVLVIDAEPEVRGVISSMLERVGFQVLAASDGRSGIALLGANPSCAAVMLDLALPESGGEETLQHIRHLRPDVPVVLVSSHSVTEVHSRVGDTSAVEVLQKPVTPTALWEALAHVLA